VPFSVAAAEATASPFACPLSDWTDCEVLSTRTVSVDVSNCCP